MLSLPYQIVNVIFCSVKPLSSGGLLDSVKKASRSCLSKRSAHKAFHYHKIFYKILI